MSTPLIPKPKRKLSDELESTAESHPMNASKRARIDMNQPPQPHSPQPLEFILEKITKFFVELSKVLCFKDPYDDENLDWHDDVVWNTIIESLQLPMKVCIDDFKVTVLSYYDMHKQGTLSTLDLSDEALSLATRVFKNQRPNVGEYLSSCFCPSQLALEYPRESSSTLSYGYGPPVMQPIQSSYPSSSSENSRFKQLIKAINKIKSHLSADEFAWAEFEMSKYDGRINMFLAMNQAERIDYVKGGWHMNYHLVLRSIKVGTVKPKRTDCLNHLKRSLGGVSFDTLESKLDVIFRDEIAQHVTCLYLRKRLGKEICIIYEEILEDAHRDVYKKETRTSSKSSSHNTSSTSSSMRSPYMLAVAEKRVERERLGEAVRKLGFKGPDFALAMCELSSDSMHHMFWVCQGAERVTFVEQCIKNQKWRSSQGL